MTGPRVVHQPVPPAPEARRRYAPPVMLAVGVAMALGLWLRLIDLGSKSLWLDEVSSVTFARMDWHSFANLLWRREGNMAFYYLLLRAWMRLGQSEFFLRLPSVLFGLATIPAIYLLGKQLFGRRCGLYAALLLAVSGAAVRASQWIRSYSLLLLLVVLSSLFLVQALERASRRRWLLYVLVTALAVYNHFMVGLLILAQWIWLALWSSRHRPGKQALAAVIGVGLLSLPAAVYMLVHNVGQLGWVPQPHPIELYHLAVFLAAGGGKAVGAAMLVVCTILLAIAAAAFRRAWKTVPRSPAAWGYLFLFLCLILPGLLSFSVSYLKPIFFYRYLIISLPAFIVLVARGLDLVRFPWPPIVFVLVMGLSVAAVSRTYTAEEDWSGACQYLLSQAQSGDAVVFNGHGRMPLDYYRQRQFGSGGPRLEFPGHPAPGNRAFAYAHPRVWFVHFPNFVSDPDTIRIESALESLYKMRMPRQFKAVTVTLYESPQAD